MVRFTGLQIDGDGTDPDIVPQTYEEFTKQQEEIAAQDLPYQIFLQEQVSSAEQTLADAEQGLKDAKGQGVTAVLEAKAAVVQAKKDLEVAQISLEVGEDVSGMTPMEIKEVKKNVAFTKEAEERAEELIPAYKGAPADQVIYGYDITQRPEGKIDNGFITYYQWVGGATTGQWTLKRAPLTADNMQKYGASVFGGTTQASYGSSSEGANTLARQPMLSKDQYGNIIGYNLDGTEFTFSGFRNVSTSGSSGSTGSTGSTGFTGSTGSSGTGSTGTGSTGTGSTGTGFNTTGLDANTAALIKSLQEQIAKLTAGNQQAGIDKAAADAAAKKERTDNAILALTDRFSKYGLSSLIPKIRELAIAGASEDTIALQLQETDEYKQRFIGNEERIKKGLKVLDPGTYLGLEDRYRQIIRAYGLKQFDNDSYVTQFISNDISPEELSSRVVNAVQRVQNADPAVSAMLRQYYNIGVTDMVAYVLDPANQLPKIERQIGAAEIGVAAGRQGLTAGVNVAEQLAAQGITQAEAQRGYATIADVLPGATKLSQIYTGVLDQYGQAEAEQEVFNSLASAQRKRRALAEREIATFTGASGLGKTALDQGTRGNF